MYKILGVKYAKGYSIQHGEYSQYFIITIIGVQHLKIMNHHNVHL